MLSLTTLQSKLFAIARLADKSGINIKYVHNGKVYLLNIEPTYETFVLNRDRRLKKQRANLKKGIPLITEECEKCGSVMLAKICINKNCELNKRRRSKSKSSVPQL